VSKFPNRFGGGARTNANGLFFEQTTDLDIALSSLGYKIIDHAVYDEHGFKIGLSVQKRAFYKCFLEPNGINYKMFNSKMWLPDECFVNFVTKTVYIIEKKFQNCNGSVDEKLASCEFKKTEYRKLCSPIGFNVEYLYVFNDWFKKGDYKDILEYIKSVDCYYFYNEIPLSFLQI
jgi:hypothetical protein